MSYQETVEAITTLNQAISRGFETGEHIPVEVSGRPRGRVHSFDPFQYERYGRRNRPGRLHGTFPVRGFLIGEAPGFDEVFLSLAIQVGTGEVYDFSVPNITMVQYVAQKVDLNITYEV